MHGALHALRALRALHALHALHALRALHALHALRSCMVPFMPFMPCMPFYALPYHIGVWKGMAGHKKGNGYKLEEGLHRKSHQKVLTVLIYLPAVALRTFRGESQLNIARCHS